MCEQNSSTPIEIASATVEREEVLSILGEFTEIPDILKLEQLSRLMYVNAEEETKEEFRKLLSTLPVKSVRAKIHYIRSLGALQASTSS